MEVPPKIIISLPNTIENHKNKDILYFYGDIDHLEAENVVYFYILEVSPTNNLKNCIGSWSRGPKTRIPSEENVVSLLKKSDGTVKLQQVKIRGEDITKKTGTENLLIIYNVASFSSEVFSDEPGCYFAKLQKKLVNNSDRPRPHRLWHILSTILSYVCNFLNKAEPVLRYSAIAMQIKLTVERFKWAFETSSQKITVKVGNFFLSVLLDITVGLVCLNILLTITSTQDFPELFLWTSENCVASLRNLLNWLRGSPAGFKLNKEFNNILAQFYLFHTEIWWLFLVFISPALGVVFQVFTVLGQFGLTFQAAILSDMLALVSFHVYCIYAYAARLYNMQQSGLISLWRLFLGRKWNPLRGKVDSCHYSSDQLFVGTLLFTILLFLLPTTLIYYVVFTACRVVIVGVGGALTRVCMYVHAVPVYSWLLWLLSAPSVSPQVRIEPQRNMSYKDLTVVVGRRVPDAFLTTVLNFIPDCVHPPPPSAIPHGLLTSLLTGQLLYPV